MRTSPWPRTPLAALTSAVVSLLTGCSGAPPVPAASSVGEAGGAARPPAPDDACSKYADCVDQMPNLQGDQPLEGVTSQIIRGWERTPERLKQCAAAHQAARVGELCP